MLKEFMDFVKKFNVLPIAIGLVLATAFLPVVDAVVNVIMSIVGGIFGASGSFDTLTFDVRDAQVPYGTVITAAISFLMVAWVVFMIVKALKKAGVGTDAGPSPTETLLTEIRDGLRNR